jgi:CRP-like cAMP-binding protein
MATRADSIHGRTSVSLKETLINAGLAPELATLLDEMPYRTFQIDSRRPFREPGAARNEVMFVKSGILSKYKPDGYGIQAIVKSEVMVGKAEDFDPIVEKNPEMARFFWRLVQRNEAIGYEWLVNCGRRDSTARVAHLLCETATRSGIDVGHQAMTNPFTQQQIADITGQTSVNVNRVFADLERQGLIRREGRQIFFEDWPEIRRVASFQASYLD